MAYDDNLTLAAGYRSGSAWGADNHFFNKPDGAIAFQPHWQPGGRPLPAGPVDGGTWRLGVSDRGGDIEFAKRLHEQVSGP